MKRAAQFLIQQASGLDRCALGIFRLTRWVISLLLLVSLILLAAKPILNDRASSFLIAEGIFHASFRIAAIGISMGFAADIAAKFNRR